MFSTYACRLNIGSDLPASAILAPTVYLPQQWCTHQHIFGTCAFWWGSIRWLNFSMRIRSVSRFSRAFDALIIQMFSSGRFLSVELGRYPGRWWTRVIRAVWYMWLLYRSFVDFSEIRCAPHCQKPNSSWFWIPNSCIFRFVECFLVKHIINTFWIPSRSHANPIT